jgi:uncharacterized protein YbjT (DUF2867 family)
MILVTGARGHAGSAVVRALADAGEEVRALVRRDEDRTGLPAGVEGVVGDLNQPETLGAASEGARGAFLLSGYRDMPDTLAGMRRAGVEHVVLLSSSAAPGGDMANAVAQYHIESEAYVRESGLSWTFLQPNSFMTNTLQWAPQIRARNAVRAPFADVPIAPPTSPQSQSGRSPRTATRGAAIASADRNRYGRRIASRCWRGSSGETWRSRLSPTPRPARR